jgi:hypothetical protein
MSRLYVGLPEDLAPLRSGRHNPRHPETSPQVRISNSGIAITAAALRMIGQPSYVSLAMGEQSRMLAIRPSDAGLGVKIGRQSGGGRIEITWSRLRIPRNRRGYSLRFEPQLVEGALLIGPLPTAKRGAS